ncbi:MAG TPA: SapC family protein [Rhodanobacter sp.]|nr:SapC family protein [Rhodanobacter sp.]
MARHALLNNVDHRDLRVDTTHAAAFGDDLMLSLTFPGEFRSVQAHYPIVFHKAPDERFQPVALFGFREGQNLFLHEAQWQAGYIPLAVARQPFLIGKDGQGSQVMYIDLDSPRVGTTQGEPLFREHGGTTDFLEHANAMLQTLHEGVSATPAFIDALMQHDLLESFVLDIDLIDGTRQRVTGFHTIHEERLRELGDAALTALHRAGHLQAIYMTIASLSNLRPMIDRMSQRDADTR